MILHKILYIMLLAYQISTKTSHDVFVYYSPHVKGLEVCTYKNGWREDAKADFYTSLYNLGDCPESDVKKLDNIIASLKKLKEESK